MKSKQIISLLLAGQMLSAPMAQATSRSLLERAQLEEQTGAKASVAVTVPSGAPGRLMLRSEAAAADKLSADEPVPAEETTPAGSQETTDTDEATTSDDTTTPADEETGSDETTGSEETTTPAGGEETTPSEETGTPETTPDVTPETTAVPEETATPEATPDVTPETTAAPEETAAPETTPAATPETTGAPEETAAPEATPAATPETTAAPEETATPEATPAATPETTAAPEETAAPETTPAVTPETTATPEATTTPEAAPVATPAATATPEAAPTATPVATAAPTVTATPEPTAAPTATVVPMPTETPVVKTTPSAVMKLLSPLAEGVTRAASRTLEQAYVGFGYEVYRAGIPSADGKPNESTSTYIYTDRWDMSDGAFDRSDPARFAVEKKPRAESGELIWRGPTTEERYKSEFNGFFGGNLYTGDQLVDGVVKAGSHGGLDCTPGLGTSFDDLYIETKEMAGKWNHTAARIADFENWLGRIPDYVFDSWYVSGWGPTMVIETLGANNTGSSNKYPGMQLWYYDQVDDADAGHKIKDSMYKYDAGDCLINLVPLRYGDWEEHPDLKIGSVLDNDAVYNAIVRPDNWLSLSNDPSVGSSHFSTFQLKTGGYDGVLPIIAHWKFSDDATLATTAAVNTLDAGDVTEKKTALYAVKASGTTGTNLLSSLYSQPMDVDGQSTVTFDPTKSGTYYLRVNSDVVGVSPEIIANEAFYALLDPTAEALGEGAGVDISFRAAGEEELTAYIRGDADPTNDQIRQEVLNDHVTKDGTLYLMNNYQFPMRSLWTLIDEENTAKTGYVNLTPSKSVASSATADDKLRNYYNELQITVTPPSGNTESDKVLTFTFYIQRLNDPKIIQNPGNTPFGMIKRDDNAGWSSLSSFGYTANQLKNITRAIFMDPTLNSPEVQDLITEADKSFALRNGATLPPYSFHRSERNLRGEDGGLTEIPKGTTENNMGIYERDKVYWPNAWLDNENPFTADGTPSGDKVNLDLSETAIIAYLDSSFVDPGFTLYDSQGELVSFVDAGDKMNPNVTRSVVLPVANGQLTGASLALTDTTEMYYTGSGMVTLPGDKVQRFQVLTDANGKDQIDLRGARVVPGIYTIEYRYHDPLSDWDYDGSSVTADHFLNWENAASFSRPLVLLPAPGDVNMDGAVTFADALALEEALKTESASGFLHDNQFLNLFKLRVCDVNDDGVVDQLDVEKLKGAKVSDEDIHGVRPYFVRNTSHFHEYYYIPLKSDLPSMEIEKNWRVRTTTSAATVPGTAELTLEYLGLHDETMLNGTDLMGIKNKDDEGKDIGADYSDIVWVGVKLSGLDQLPTTAKTLGDISYITVTLAYDSHSVSPVAIVDGKEKKKYTEAEWLDTVRTYNVQSSGGAQDRSHAYLWPNGYSIVELGTWSEGNYLLHSSKAIMEGESKWNGVDLRQMRITLACDDPSLLRKLSTSGDQYLLRMPFKVKVRNDPEATTMSAIDMALGMADFNLCSGSEEASWCTNVAEGIFGGVSKNLADEIVYNNDPTVSTGRAIPLTDETKLPVVVLSSRGRPDDPIVYGEKVDIDLKYTNSEGETVFVRTSTEDFNKISGMLPSGLTIGQSGDVISGTVLETKTILFSVDPHPVLFKLEIHKAPLNVTAVGQEIYYGEEPEEFTFIYDTSMIRALDIPPLGANSKLSFDNSKGTPEELAKLDGYKPPKLSTVYKSGDDVGGDYKILISSDGDPEEKEFGLDNYYYVYTDGTVKKQAGVLQTEMSKNTHEDEGSTPLTVKKRPIQIQKITNSESAVSFHVMEFQTTRWNVEAAYQKDVTTEFTLRDLTTLASYQDLLTGTPIFGDDKVTVTYNATVKRDTDFGGGPYYDLQGKQMGTREGTISSLKLKDAEAGVNKNGNYELLGLVDNKGKVTITANPVIALEMVNNAPSTGPYEYGTGVGLELMTVRFKYSMPTISSDPESIYSPTYTFLCDGSYIKAGIHVTYETLEDINKGNLHWDTNSLYDEVDGREVIKPLAADVHNGKYICVSSDGQVDDGTGKLVPGKILWHSPKPLEVTRKNLDVTAQDIWVYYGEYQPAILSGHFTYDPKGLTDEDAAIIRAATGKAPTGASEELKHLGSVDPVLTAAVGAYGSSDAVSQGTPVRWDDKGVLSYYNIYITNATDGTGKNLSGTANYQFRYRTNGVVSASGVGAAKLVVVPRPIVVDSVTLGKYSKTYIYDDTTVPVLEAMADSSDQLQRVTAVGLNTAKTGVDADDTIRQNADTFVAKLPGTGYYEQGVMGSAIPVNQYNGVTVLPGTPGGNVLTGDAIYNGGGQLDQLQLTYQAVYTVDDPKAAPPDSTYFKMDGKVERTAEVTIQKVDLMESGANDNRNYRIVYANPGPAIGTVPAVTPKTEGRVILRPLTSVSVARGPSKTSYTYGEQLSLSGMSLALRFAGDGDNAPASNRSVIERTEIFRAYGNGSTSFSEKGLKLYWMTDAMMAMSQSQLASYLGTNGVTGLEEVDEKSYPDVPSTGRKLLVYGRRSTGHTVMWAVSADWGLKVSKKTLPLTVENIDRYYGEHNTGFKAYYTLADLAQPDRDTLLAGTPGLTANSRFYLTAVQDPTVSRGRTDPSPLDVSTIAVNPELTLLNSAYEPVTRLAVRFFTTGTQGSSVGKYPIQMELLKGDVDGDGKDDSQNLANYELSAASALGQMRVFRRPIQVQQVFQAPLSTIYVNTRECEFPATVDQLGQMTVPGTTGFMTVLPVADGVVYESDDPDVIAAKAESALRMTLTGDAVFGDGSDKDKLGLNLTVVFPAAESRQKFVYEDPAHDYSGAYQRPQDVNVRALSLNGNRSEGYDSENYWLVFSSSDKKGTREPNNTAAVGQLDRRPIIGIAVKVRPDMEYDYGETMSLNDLAVTVEYKVLPEVTESYETTQDLSYKDMSLSGRLAVNYWDSPDAPLDISEYVNNVKRYPAANGDHLTIAPSHEERFMDDNGVGIGHSGMYLLLTAREDASMEYEAPAVVVKSETAGPIVVHKKDLLYTLTAEDKIYNSAAYANRGAAAGTITLTNVFKADDEDRDLVFVSTDATEAKYGRYATDPAALAALKADQNIIYALTEDIYVFPATGAPGSTGLTFTFFDENVVYYDETYTPDAPVAPENWLAYWEGADHSVKKAGETGKWDVYGTVAPMPVRVSNIVLRGPDAANYSLDASVGYANAAYGNESNPLAQNVDQSVGSYTGKSPVPYATIGKATQAIDVSAFAQRPVLSVEAHSNAVKLTYDADGANFGRIRDAHSGDAYNDELHYEYNLEYLGKAEGSEGEEMLPWEAWSDRTYFGGEKMWVTNEGGYTPIARPTVSPSDKVFSKGQLYAWEKDDEAFGSRKPLERNTVYWGTVRLAETHNYFASEAVSAFDSMAQAMEQKEKALSASKALSQEVLGWATVKPTEETRDPELTELPAVKTYAQAFKVVSTERIRDIEGLDHSEDVLEAVWFSDVQQYRRAEELSAVLRNLVETRYYTFYWDQPKRTSINFGRGVDLSQPMIVELERWIGNTANTERVTQEVNVGDDPAAPRPATAVIYASLRSEGGTLYPEKIEIVSGGGGGAGGAEVPVGDEILTFEQGSTPVTLEVKFKPALTIKELLIWKSSDPRVVQVGEDGKLYFVGIGTAEITATTLLTRKEAKVKVRVVAPKGQALGKAGALSLELAARPENRFDFYCAEAYFTLDDHHLFHPEQEMTRAELVSVLARFYTMASDWTWDGKDPFPDVSKDAAYCRDVALLRDAGILVGLPDGTFGTENTATRSEVVTILCRMMGLEPKDFPEEERLFQDYNPQTVWSAPYVETLARAGVVNGIGNGNFAPGRNITRAELAAMLGRILLSGGYYGSTPVIPEDVTEQHWAYELILRAVNSAVAGIVPDKK